MVLSVVWFLVRFWCERGLVAVWIGWMCTISPPVVMVLRLVIRWSCIAGSGVAEGGVVYPGSGGVSEGGGRL